MSNFKSGLIFINTCVLCNHNEDYDELFKELNINDTSYNNFIRVELTPLNNEWWSDCSTWIFTVNDDEFPNWFKKDPKKYEVMFRESVKEWQRVNIVRNKTLDLIDDGTIHYLDRCKVIQYTIKDTNSDKTCGLYVHNSKIEKVSGYSVIESMSGTSSIFTLCEHAQVKVMSDQSKINKMYDYALVHHMYDNSIIDCAHNQSVIEMMHNNSFLYEQKDVTKVKEMYDHAIVTKISDEAVINTMNNYSHVVVMVDTSVVGSMLDESSIGVLSDNSHVCIMRDNSYINCMICSSSVGITLNTSRITNMVHRSFISIPSSENTTIPHAVMTPWHI